MAPRDPDIHLQDLYYAAIAPREGCRAARHELLDAMPADYQYGLDAWRASVALLNAVSLIALYEKTFGEGAYIALLQRTSNHRR